MEDIVAPNHPGEVQMTTENSNDSVCVFLDKVHQLWIMHPVTLKPETLAQHRFIAEVNQGNVTTEDLRFVARAIQCLAQPLISR